MSTQQRVTDHDERLHAGYLSQHKDERWVNPIHHMRLVRILPH